MTDIHQAHTALGDVAARTLANATKTVPMMGGTITPRWLTHVLQWVPVEAGIYRVNKVKDPEQVEVDCSAKDERELPATFVDYQLMAYATRGLSAVPGLRLIGIAAEKAGVLSFALKGITSEAVGEALNRDGIAVRSSHHCAQPILHRFDVETTVRPSLALYNTCSDIDVLVTALHRIQGGHGNF